MAFEEDEAWLEVTAKKLYSNLVDNKDWDNVIYYDILNTLREVYERGHHAGSTSETNERKIGGV